MIEKAATNTGAQVNRIKKAQRVVGPSANPETAPKREGMES